MNENNSHLLLILEQVAKHKGISETHLQPPLYEAIDTDALESLLSGSCGPPIKIQFEYSGYRILASSDGTVEVTG